MLDIKQSVEAKISELKPFGGEITFERILTSMLVGSCKETRPVEKDGVLYRERGCSGSCACMGHCRQLVPYTELDKMRNKHKQQEVDLLTPVIEECLEKMRY